MYPNKFTRFVAIVSLAGFYGIANAAVYDFGNIDTESGNSKNSWGTHIGTYNIGSRTVANGRSNDSYTEEVSHKNSLEFMNGDVSSASSADSVRNIRIDRHYNLDQIKRKVKEGRLYPEKDHEEGTSGSYKEQDEDSSSSGSDHDDSYAQRDETTYTPIASPVPEPENYAMILAGLGLIAMTLRRRKEAP